MRIPEALTCVYEMNEIHGICSVYIHQQAVSMNVNVRIFSGCNQELKLMGNAKIDSILNMF